jgi:hypothetical protein
MKRIFGHEADTPEELLPESMLRLYRYGLATGYEPITLFRGEDYGIRRYPYPLIAWGAESSIPAVQQVIEKYGLQDLMRQYPKTVASLEKTYKTKPNELDSQAKSLIKLGERTKGQKWSEGQNPVEDLEKVGKFVENTAKAAGKEIGKVTKPIQNAVGDISKEVGKIPVVGGLVQGVFDLTYMAYMWPAELAVDIVVNGKRIDTAVLDTIKKEIQSVKQVAPYAQMVIALVPGIGPGISAAISAGLALAEGQSIEEVIKAGLIGAIPGGPLVKAAVTMSLDTIQRVASGQPLDLTSLMQSAGGAASSALGLPTAAKNALLAGVTTMGAVIKGAPLDKALTDGAIAALPVSQQVKNAMTEATTLTLELANGKPLDRVLLARIDKVSSMLPTGHALRETINTGISTTKKLAEGKSPENVMLIALQSGIGDSLVSMGATKLPPEVQNALKSGVALGTGVVAQARKAEQLVQKVPGKLIESGVQLAKAHPLFGAARKIAATQGGTRGFDLAAGLTQHQAKVFDITTARNSLPNAVDKIGFDLACATRVGAVTNPKPLTKSAEAHAGHAITMGMQGYVPGKKQVLMATVERVPPAAAGATAAVKEVAQLRASPIQQALRAIHIK